MCAKTFSRISVAAIGTVAAVGAFATAGHAATFTEGRDAGKTIETASYAGIVGTEQLTQFIRGQFEAGIDFSSDNSEFPELSNLIILSDDVDLFKITLPSGGVLTATTQSDYSTNQSGGLLHLFDERGRYLNGSSSNGLQSFLTSSLLTPGRYYYLGITRSNISPSLDVDNILTSWRGEADYAQKTIPYRIEFGVGGTNNVPTPALLPGLFALGVGVLRKRKQQPTEGTIA
jgi:hypothetical protein